jgi:hypothetical protein
MRFHPLANEAIFKFSWVEFRVQPPSRTVAQPKRATAKVSEAAISAQPRGRSALRSQAVRGLFLPSLSITNPARKPYRNAIKACVTAR